MRKFFIIFCLLQSTMFSTLTAQEYAISKINPELFLNANAVIRSEKVEIEIKAIDEMLIRTKRVVTVLNEYGDRHTQPGDIYDDNTRIIHQEAYIFDETGNEIRKIKKKDFVDRSLVGGGTLYSDNRLSYYNYTPNKYPYTLVYESEVKTSSTIFVMPWQPISTFLVSVESSEYRLKNSAKIPLRFEERNFTDFSIQKVNSELDLQYKAENLKAIKREPLAPALSNFSPKVFVALNQFSLVGVEGNATNWKEFGKWQYENLLRGKRSLPQSTVQEIELLTANATSELEKARLIYDYVQQKTRYISVQLGIGGWEPMPAADVDKLGYGDCKALTNYTQALLDSQNISSNYAVVYGGEHKNIDPDFASMQGNHAILNLPQENGDVWLECTSQTTPFNYMGDFTDDRSVLLVKPDGGEIVKTTKYLKDENLRQSLSQIILNKDGGFSARTKRESSGVPYGDIYLIERKKENDQVLFYKEEWGNLHNIQIENLKFKNDRINNEFIENITFSGEKLASKAGKRLLLPINFFIPETFNLPRNESRTLPLEIKRGKLFKDNFEYKLPQNFITESIPESIAIDNDFGSYSLVVEKITGDDGEILKVAREYTLNEGVWTTEEYSAYRDFMNEIKSLNNQKAVIIANN